MRAPHDHPEDHVKEWPSTEIREKISTIRHDILHVRRVLAPTRDAARAVLDDRVELDGEVSLFPRDIELHFADAYDKLLRATDGCWSNPLPSATVDGVPLLPSWPTWICDRPNGGLG